MKLAEAADPVAVNDTVGALTDNSLVRHAKGSWMIHRLIQDATRHRMADQPAVICPTNAIGSLNARYQRAVKARGHGHRFARLT